MDPFLGTEPYRGDGFQPSWLVYLPSENMGCSDCAVRTQADPGTSSAYCWTDWRNCKACWEGRNSGMVGSRSEGSAWRWGWQLLQGSWYSWCLVWFRFNTYFCSSKQRRVQRSRNRYVPWRFRSAPRLVHVIFNALCSNQGTRSIQGGFNPRLYRWRSGSQDVKVTWQRNCSTGSNWQVRCRRTAFMDCFKWLHRWYGSISRDLQAFIWCLPSCSQHCKIPACKLKRL